MIKHVKKYEKINFIILLFRIISFIIIIICIYQLYNWHVENKKNSNILEDIILNYNDSIKQIIIDEKSISVFDVKIQNLIEKNSDTIGWINVKGTKINYPVVKYKDNDYYLTHSFDKSYNSAGWIFASYVNKFDGTDKNIIFFGHNRKDGSMFAGLKDTIKEKWYKNEENYYITFETLNEIQIYKVFSNYKIEAENYYLTNSFKNNKEYKSFIDMMKRRSVYNYNVPVDENSSIITLSTCANEGTYRIVLHAVRVK